MSTQKVKESVKSPSHDSDSVRPSRGPVDSRERRVDLGPPPPLEILRKSAINDLITEKRTSVQTEEPPDPTLYPHPKECSGSYDGLTRPGSVSGSRTE